MLHLPFDELSKDYLPSGDFAGLVEAICEWWNDQHPHHDKRADHFTTFARSGSRLRTKPPEDRRIMPVDRFEADPHGASCHHGLYFEFRYSEREEGRIVARSMGGTRLDSHTGPHDLFLAFSALALENGVRAAIPAS